MKGSEFRAHFGLSLVSILVTLVSLFASPPALADCPSHLLEIDEIAQSLGRRILVEETQAGAVELKIARAIGDVITTIEPHLGPLKLPRSALFLRWDSTGHTAYSYTDGLHFNSEFISAWLMSSADIKIVAAHEIGHSILNRNLSEKNLRAAVQKNYYHYSEMRAHYSELFAGLNVLLFTKGDPRAEADMAASTGAPPWVAKLFRWDIAVPLSRKVDSGKVEIYGFFRAARSSLWRNYLAGASRKETATVMRAFILATERHINLRIDRGELGLQTWTRRAPRLNREFMEIFDEEYLKVADK